MLTNSKDRRVYWAVIPKVGPWEITPWNYGPPPMVDGRPLFCTRSLARKYCGTGEKVAKVIVTLENKSC